MHKPTRLDAVTDLRRCIYASFSKDKFDDVNYKMFLKHAMGVLEKMELNKVVVDRIKKSQDKNLEDGKRREDLLTASIFLQSL